MGDNFENQQAAAYSKLISQHPLSPHVDEAKSRLKAMNRPIPEVDQVAYAHEKYEMDNRTTRGFMSKMVAPFVGHPDFTPSAKSGNPSMEGLHPMIPASVPVVATGSQGTSANPGMGGAGSDVTATTVKDTSLIDTAPNVLPGATGGAATPAAGATGEKGAAATGATGEKGAAPAGGEAPTGAAVPATPGSPVTVNGIQTTQTKQQALPQNHTGKIRKLSVQQQLKETQKQQEQFKKLAKKQADQQKKAQEAQAKLDKKAAEQKKKKGDSTAQPPQQPTTTPPAAPVAKQ
jgi:outer membrane protein assembly factor BamD